MGQRDNTRVKVLAWDKTNLRFKHMVPKYCWELLPSTESGVVS